MFYEIFFRELPILYNLITEYDQYKFFGPIFKSMEG